MPDHMPDDLSAAGRDLRAYTDQLRPKHPVVRNTNGEWVLLRHADILAAALDHKRFSSQVSRFLQIPNGLDGQEHTLYRTIVERYLSPEAVEPYLPTFQKVANELAANLPRGEVVDAVNDIGAVFAVRAQCAWLGWPAKLEPDLLAWMQDNHAATRSGNHRRMAVVAEQFDDIIRSVIQPRRASGDAVPDDLTTKLYRQTVNGRLLTEAELVSILRNWTGGDLGSIALCVGVITAHLATHPELVMRIRDGSDAETEAIINEILRLDNPFVSNRRITTCPVKIGDQTIPEGEKVKLNWTSANRDEAVFDNNSFNPDAHATSNLLYGAGKHACPGQLLATCELRIALQTILATVQQIRFAPGEIPEREVAPVGGYRRVPIVLS
ncbi:cytochrome P450 [Marinobacter sp. S0848L]|uniref:cytochrome P450 n=1 Tax=Marinobacter sp. S0848L TaxID=2926423 RepID=UPI001FF25311|nr:cytochrome P450 [Marinobacter sp. S0848L]MCK0107204.1 cytochrome P450 [Marinobacter sp. S0848L]